MFYTDICTLYIDSMTSGTKSFYQLSEGFPFWLPEQMLMAEHVPDVSLSCDLGRAG